MIDTDKYEKDTRWLIEQFTHAEMADEMSLLIAEVKRLRELLKGIIAEVKRLRELLKDIADSSSANADYIKERIKEEVIE